MKTETKRQLKDLIKTYDCFTEVMEHDSAKLVKEDRRAYGGFIRSAKGKLQEYITNELVHIAWNAELAKDSKRLSVNSNKIRIPIKLEYVETIRNRAIKDYVLANIQRFYYGLSVDKHVFIDEKMILGIECKAYTENAMIKRILVDFQLLKTKMPDLFCCLFQLESQLGWDYSSEASHAKANPSATALMSYFPNVALKVVTVFPPVKQIDECRFPKELTIEKLEKALMFFVSNFQNN
jgi:hypothetical protein